jgi:hypothetical protein
MKINVGQVIDEETQERVVCGFVEFSSSEEEPKIMFVDEKEVKLANGSVLTFSSTYEKSTKHISVFAREQDCHVFRAVFNWDYIATGFAFRSVDGIFTELFFEK